MSRRPEILKCTVSSCLTELRCVEKLTSQAGARLSLSQDQIQNLAIAVTEAVGNAIVHGNRKDPKKKVGVVFRLLPDSVEVSVTDEGKGFDPGRIDDPLEPANLMKENGRGIFILKNLMDEVQFDFSPKGTTLRMVMKIRRDAD
ncbi:MAG TPA: ATP-binding protein [bacterium]|nr:ATP-binding protein [bacterium]